MSDRVKLSYDDAIALLPDGDEIHVFSNPGMNMLVGADWSRESILELIKNGEPELAGEMAMDMGHGLIAWESETRPLFIKTKEMEDDKE